MTALVKLFNIWRDTPLSPCCFDIKNTAASHWMQDKRGRFLKKPYNRVCPREQAWRDYYEYRDSIMMRESTEDFQFGETLN